jgi:UDP-N-acetylmuramoyl-tripeptide--D-alanyl-D-alanine ligase
VTTSTPTSSWPRPRERRRRRALPPGAGLAEAGLPGLEVGEHARRRSARWPAAGAQQFTLPLIAVTGSNGKTTVTQMLAAILRLERPGVAGHPGQLQQRHRRAADAAAPARQPPGRGAGTGHEPPGRDCAARGMARPTVALVNNAQREHLEFMATVEAVAQENGAVIAALPADGVAVFPQSDPFTACGARWPAGAVPAFCDHRRRPTPSIRGARPGTPHGATAPGGAGTHTPPASSRHSPAHRRAGTTCTTRWRPSPARWRPAYRSRASSAGLEAFEPVKGRSRAMEITMGKAAITLVDDSYNANPGLGQCRARTCSPRCRRRA